METKKEKNVNKINGDIIINSVPQSQGAVGRRAAEMPAGSKALAELAGNLLDVPVNYVNQERSTSPTEHGVASYAILTGPNLKAQREAIAGIEKPILTIGGDCGVEFVPIDALRQRYGAGLGVIWYDAHPDLKTPETAHDGAYHAMVLAGLLGESAPKLTSNEPLDPKRVALVSARGAIEAEWDAIDRGMGSLTDNPASMLKGTTDIYIHVDVDVLDPSEFPGHNMPEPEGMKISELVDSLDTLKDFNVVGAGITECVGTPEEVKVLAPIILKLGELIRQ